MLGGYMGKILEVDLSTGKISEEELPGGYGLSGGF